MPLTVTASSASAKASGAPSRISSQLLLLGLALGAVWFVVCRHLGAEWSYNEQYNYGWFVPFFALYLFWLRWEDRPAPHASRSPGRNLLALAISLPALFLLLPVRLIEVANPDWRLISWIHALAVVTLTIVLVWWMGGRPWLRHFSFPILFFLVAVPWFTGIEQPIIQGLMPLVASIATETLSLFGIPAEVQGNLIRINEGVIGVNEACSGVRSLQTSIMIGLLFGELTRLSPARRVALLVAAIGIAFVANCGRAFFLVWIAANRGIAAVEHWHDYAGYAIVLLVFAGSLGLTKLLGGKQPKPAEAPAARSFPLLPSAVFIVAVLAFVVAAEIAVEMWYRAHERTLQPSAQWSVRWPEHATEFKNVPIDERTRTILHDDEGRGATWRGGLTAAANPSEPTGSLLYFFRWRPGHNSALLANAHRPDVCLPSSGWKQTGDFGVREYPVSDHLSVPFRHFQFDYDGQGHPRSANAFYCVWEDRVREQSSEAQARALASEPSAWTRSERLQAVAQGRRHLGQQVMEYLLISPRPLDPKQAEDLFAATAKELVVPNPTTP